MGMGRRRHQQQVHDPAPGLASHLDHLRGEQAIAHRHDLIHRDDAEPPLQHAQTAAGLCQGACWRGAGCAAITSGVSTIAPKSARARFEHVGMVLATPEVGQPRRRISSATSYRRGKMTDTISGTTFWTGAGCLPSPGADTEQHPGDCATKGPRCWPRGPAEHWCTAFSPSTASIVLLSATLQRPPRTPPEIRLGLPQPHDHLARSLSEAEGF